MFSVIYSFQVKPGHIQDFLEAWHEMTLLIRDYEGGLGSRLHRQNETNYIAYAQWPDKTTWSQSGNKLPPSADNIRQKMRASCDRVETLFELDVVDDLLVGN